MTIEAANADKLPARPLVRILRAAEAQAWQDGFGFLEAARRESDRLRSEARRAYADEYARAYVEGKSKGQEEAAQLILETTLKVDRYLNALEIEVRELALGIVRKVLGELDVSVIVAKAATEAVSKVRRGKLVRVTVNPRTVEHVRDELNAILQDSKLGFTVELKVDGALAEGACIVATDFAVIDMSVDAQLNALEALAEAYVEAGA